MSESNRDDLDEIKDRMERASETIADLARRARDALEEAGDWLNAHSRTIWILGIGAAAAGVAAYLIPRARGSSDGGETPARAARTDGIVH